jgi:hypothetical protein
MARKNFTDDIFLKHKGEKQEQIKLFPPFALSVKTTVSGSSA